MAIHPAHVLSHFGLDRLQQEIVKWVQSVREDELGPREDSQLIAGSVEVVSSGKLIGWLIDTATPDTELWPKPKPSFER